MWFRNLLVYRLTAPLDLDADRLEQALSSRPARPCASQEPQTCGFIAPLGKGENAPLLHAGNGCLLLAIRREERILPGSVVRDALQEKIEEIETAQMRKVYKKERDQLKDEIIHSLMPRAFIRRAVTRAAIDPQAGLVYVDAGSPKKAEELLSTLREVLGSLPLRPLNVKLAPTASFTDWVRSGNIGCGLSLEDECELRDTTEDGGIVRCKRQDLGSDEVQNHLAAGKLVTRLALDWSEKLRFVLDDKLAIKRLKFADLLQEEADSDAGDELEARQAASFILMMLTFAEFLPRLLEALGGEDNPGSEA
jgi:recombination associated protein RdgC